MQEKSDNNSAKRNPFEIIFFALSIVLVILSICFLAYSSISVLIRNSDNNRPNESDNVITMASIENNNDLTGYKVIYADHTNEAISKINIKDTYKADLIITTRYDNISSTEKYVITKYKEKILAVSDEKRILFDGSNLFVITKLYDYSYNNVNEDSFYSELGITPLNFLLNNLMSSSYQLYSQDDKSLMIVNDDVENNLREIFEISLETGIITYESHSYNNSTYKFSSVENFDVIDIEDINDSIFTIY